MALKSQISMAFGSRASIAGFVVLDQLTLLLPASVLTQNIVSTPRSARVSSCGYIAAHCHSFFYVSPEIYNAAPGGL
jgi:hypothetical protein